MSLGVIASHAVIAAAGNAYDIAVLANTPLLYLKCDDLAGTTATDDSGNSRPGTINGSISLGAAGLFSNSAKAFDLAGSGGGALTVPYAAWMPLNSAAFSIEMWINPDSLSGIRGLAGRDGSPRGWEWYINGSKLTLDVPFVSPSSGSAVGSTTLSTGVSRHIVLTYDGTNAKQYLDAVQDAACVTTMLDPSAQLTIGACAGGSIGGLNFLFDGRVDNVAYYGTALSAGDVAAHYAAR
jgi:hypothetical protein